MSELNDLPNQLPSPPEVFPSVSYREWLKRVEEENPRGWDDLTASVGDDEKILPFYGPDTPEVVSADDAAKIAAAIDATSVSRPRGWIVCREVSRWPDLHQTESAIGEGVEWLWLSLRLDQDPAPDWEESLSRIRQSGIGLTVQAGSSTPAALACVLSSCDGDPGNIPPVLAAMDPLGDLARSGRSRCSLEHAFQEMAHVWGALGDSASRFHLPLVSTSPYHDGGAFPVQELGLAVATGVEYLRRLTDLGLETASVAERMVFEFSVAGDLFQEIAKLRAARVLWNRVLGEYGFTGPMFIHARDSFSTKTRYDRWTNLVRVSNESLAAALGQADLITVQEYDRRAEATRQAERFSSNVELILREEAQLHRVRDPARGSFYIETATKTLAESAWEMFREIEGRGGMSEVLGTGWVNQVIEAARKRRLRGIAEGQEPIIGVTKFPIVEEHLPAPGLDSASGRPPQATEPDDESIPLNPEYLQTLVTRAASGASVAELAKALPRHQGIELEPVPRFNRAEPFERLRGRLAELLGERPQATLLTRADQPEARRQLGTCRSLLEPIGIEVQLTERSAEVGAGADRAPAEFVIVSTGDIGSTWLSERIPKLEERGARMWIALSDGAAELPDGFQVLAHPDSDLLALYETLVRQVEKSP